MWKMSMRIFCFAKFQVFNVTNLIQSTFNFPLWIKKARRRYVQAHFHRSPSGSFQKVKNFPVLAIIQDVAAYLSWMLNNEAQ